MKNIILLILLFTTQLFSLTIVLNSAKDDGKSYAVLHIEDKEPVDCQTITQSLDKKIYLCKFNKVIKTPIETKKMKLADIDFLEKEKEFYIRIVPKVKSKLMPVRSSLFVTDEVSLNNKKKSFKHWTILLYEKSPFKVKYVDDKIDFPIIYPKNVKPYIGALDLNGAPISYVQSNDIKLYLELKKSYERKKYLDVVEDSIDIIKKYPNTIFKSEFLLYRLKALDKGMENSNSNIDQDFDFNDIVSEGKAWIKSFPSDNNIPEIVMLIAKAYLKMGFKADANYFMDILISEHENSPYTKQGILIFADSLYNSKDKVKARKLYEDVLYSAQDLDIAAQAAIRLGNVAMDSGKKDEAKTYLIKVLEANKEFIKKDKKSSYALALKLSENKLYDVAASIVDLLFEDLKKIDEDREKLLKDSGIWHAKATNIKEAYDRLQQYLKEYKYGEYKDEVQTNLDELFFELNETNETKLANYYDELISKYQNKIGDKAVVEKAKLLFSQKRYEDVLKMKSSLDYVNDNNSSKNHKIIEDAASALVLKELDEDNCNLAVNYIEKYNLEVEVFDKVKVFDCFIKTARFEKAETHSQKYIKSKNLKDRFTWLQKYLLSQYSLNKHEKVANIGEDILGLSKLLKTKAEHKTLQMMFFSLMKLDRFEKAIEIAKIIEKENPDELKNADVFIDIVKKATDNRDDLLLSKYADKIIKLQNRYKSYVYTPIVEFNLIGALQRLEKTKEALDVAKGLISKKITDKEKIRAFYNAGELSMKLKQNDEAKKYFQECTNIKEQSSWKDICEQNLKLL